MTIPGAPATAPDRSVARTYHGKYPGVVVDRAPAGESGHHRGELVVRVPGILEEDASGNQRSLEAVAKPCFMPGLFWIPEVGDTVWVEFAAGDINHPIWTGVWYAAGSTPANVDGARPTEDQKVLRSTSGQVVYLEDTGGSERLHLEDEMNRNRIVLDGNGIKLEAGGCTIELGGSTIKITNGVHTFEMTATGTKLTDAMSMSPHAIVLEPVLTWLSSHQHVGNMGAPTPIFPPQLVQIMLHANAGSGKSSL